MTTSQDIIHGLNFDPFDPARKNGFLVEWRVTPNSPTDQAIAKAQQHLIDNHQPKIQVLKSCAAGNFHITLNEFPIENPAQLHQVIQFSQEFAATVMPKLAAQFASTTGKQEQSKDNKNLFNIYLDGIKDFRQETFYVNLKGAGVDFLKLVYNEFHRLLFERFPMTSERKAILPSSKPKRELTAHITVGRAQRGGCGEAADWYEKLINDKTLTQLLSAENVPGGDLGEIVFCSRRHPTNESQPPLIFKMFPTASAVVKPTKEDDEKISKKNNKKNDDDDDE